MSIIRFDIYSLFMMKKVLAGFILFVFYSLSTFADIKYLNWLDGSVQLRKRIDLNNKKLELEFQPGQWQLIRPIELDSLVSQHLPPRTTCYSFYLGQSKWRFVLAGTGIVFDFDEARGLLSKADRTYYAGYNFGASVFRRKDTLHSFGGSGFWNFSQALTFFDEKSKEWENIKAENLGPKSIFNGFHGYDLKSDLFYSGGSEYHSFLSKQPTEIDAQFHAFDFTTNRWKLLGTIMPKLLEAKGREIRWSGRYFVQFSGEEVFIIDPVNNQVYHYQNKTKSYKAAPLMYIQEGIIYGYWDEEGGKRLSISIAELLKNSKPIGQFYLPKSKLKYIFAGLFVLVLLGIVFTYYRKNNKRFQLNLDEQELTFMNSLLASPEGSLTTIQVNDLLGLSKKNLDNQRKLRLNIISNINHQIYLKYRIENAIVRISSSDDKRQSLYTLKTDVLPILKQEFS
jgi:hypothetical protein